MAELWIEIMDEDFLVAGPDPCAVFARAIARSAGHEVLVHKGPLKTPTFDARCMPSSMDSATSYYLHCEPESYRLPGRLQVMASALTIGPNAGQIWVKQGKGDDVKRAPVSWCDIVKPCRVLLDLMPQQHIVRLAIVPPPDWIRTLDDACARHQAKVRAQAGGGDQQGLTDDEEAVYDAAGAFD